MDLLNEVATERPLCGEGVEGERIGARSGSHGFVVQARKKPKGKNGAEVVPARRTTSAGGTAIGEARRRAAVDNMIDGILIIGDPSSVPPSDPAAEPVLGPSVSGVVGQSRTNRHHNADDAAVLMWRNKAA